MADAQFIATEGAVSNQQSLKIFGRFLASLKFLHKMFPLAFVLMVLSTSAPQVFLWLTGEYSQCQNPAGCDTKIPYLGSSLHLTPWFLCWFAVVSAVLRLLSWAVFEISGQWAARGIHRSMVHAVARVRTTFFDENPSGRLINRLVRDYDSLRMSGVIRVGDSTNYLLEVLCVAALILLAHPIGALLVLPTLVVFFYIQQQVAPMLQRCATIRSVRLSDVLHRETDMIEGARTFLLYGKERALLERLQAALSRFVQIHLTRAHIEAWGRFWTSTVATVYGFSTLLIVAAAIHYGTISDVLGTIIITLIFRLSPLFAGFTWTTGYLIESIATARRVFEYVDLPDETTQERAVLVPATAALSTEHLSGEIQFKDYTMSYRPSSPIILENLSLTLPGGKLIGVVGRTGAGKTSLMQSLYRMVYVHKGDITIGGKSIFDFDIEFVRAQFGMVPQDPYLFEGTVASNLDRAGALPRQRLEEALRRVDLAVNLDARVTEGGANFSLGERQLLCLARVVLLDRRIVLMDEPTSSVDTITDKKIQHLLASELAGRTVITIAHRLETLSRYDLIVELKEGRIARIGEPRIFRTTLSRSDLV